MAEIYEVLELTNDGKTGSGFFQKTVRTDDPETGPFALCMHQHTSKEDADCCPDAVEKMPKYLHPNSPEALLDYQILRQIDLFKHRKPNAKIKIKIEIFEQETMELIRKEHGDSI